MATIKINGNQVTFRLRTVGDNLFVEATHINDEPEIAGNVLSIGPDGRFVRCTHVNDAFGFKLNADSQIKKSKGE